MILIQAIRFLRISISRQIQSQHPVSCLGKESHLVSPDKPELREPVAEQHHGLLLVLLSLHPGLDIVEPHPIDLDIVVAAVLRVQETGGGHSARLHLEQPQSDQEEPESEPDEARDEEEAADTNTHNPGHLHVQRTTPL